MLKGFLASAALLLAASTGATAAPLGLATTPPGIVLAFGGCGIGEHPTPYGDCVLNRRAYVGPGFRRLPPPCPRGYVRDIDPDRLLCYPRY